MSDAPKYKRVLLKLSGEGLMGGQEFGFEPEAMERIAKEVKAVCDMGVEVCLVIGAGNIFRGLKEWLPAWNDLAPIIWACWQLL